MKCIETFEAYDEVRRENSVENLLGKVLVSKYFKTKIRGEHLIVKEQARVYWWLLIPDSQNFHLISYLFLMFLHPN